MKKSLLTFFLTTVIFTVKAQNFQGYSDAVNQGSGFSYNVKISITPNGATNNTLHAGSYIVKLISVNPDSKGYYNKGKTNRYFSCSELGSICNANQFEDVYVNLNYQCQNSGSETIRFTKINQENIVTFRLQPGAKCDFQLQSVSVKNNSSIYSSRIREIEYPAQKSNSDTGSKNNTSPASVTSPNKTNDKVTELGLSMSDSDSDRNSSSGQTTGNASTEIPSLESQYAKLGIPANTPTYTKSETTTQVVTQAAGVVGGLLDDWNASREKRIAAEQAAYKQQQSIEAGERLKKYEAKFIAEYLPLMDQAKKGDENARMTLYFASASLFSKSMSLREINGLMKH